MYDSEREDFFTSLLLYYITNFCLSRINSVEIELLQ